MRSRIGQVALAALVLLAIWFVATHSSEMADWIRGLVNLVDKAGAWGVLVFVVSVAVTVVLLLPGLFLSVGAGFLFGAIQGTALFMFGEILGAVMAFWLARRFLGTRALEYFQRHPKLGILNTALADEGWKFIALTRMMPLFPFKLSNYFFGAMGFRFSGFFWGTLLGTMPLCFTLAYLGSMLPDLTGLENHNAWENPLGRGVALASGAVAVAGLAMISRRAHRSFRQKMAAFEKNQS